MVLLGGLEFLAVGYLIHEHNKNKEERRLDEAEEEFRASERRRRRHNRSHSRERRHHSSSSTYEQDHKHHRYESEERPARHSRPQYLAPEAAVAHTVRPQRANSAPPPEGYYAPSAPGKVQPQPILAPVPQGHPQGYYPEPAGFYPPTGWPSDWDQSRRTDPNTPNGRPAYPRHVSATANTPVPAAAAVAHRSDRSREERREERREQRRGEAGPLPEKYGWFDEDDQGNALSDAGEGHASSSRRRGRSDARRPSRSPATAAAAAQVYASSQPVSSPHVRFAVPGGRGRDVASPPPEYRP